MLTEIWLSSLLSSCMIDLAPTPLWNNAESTFLLKWIEVLRTVLPQEMLYCNIYKELWCNVIYGRIVWLLMSLKSILKVGGGQKMTKVSFTQFGPLYPKLLMHARSWSTVHVATHAQAIDVSARNLAFPVQTCVNARLSVKSSFCGVLSWYQHYSLLVFLQRVFEIIETLFTYSFIEMLLRLWFI